MKGKVEYPIKDIVENALNLPTIKEKLQSISKMDYYNQAINGYVLDRVFMYCFLMRDIAGSKEFNDGITEFIELEIKDEETFLKRKIAKKLNIPESEIESKKEEIFDYAFCMLYEKGYVFRSVNGGSVQKIEKQGLNPFDTKKQKEKTDVKSEILKINEIFEKHGVNNIFGQFINDHVQNHAGWFYDWYPRNAMQYVEGPEWFAEFCGRAGPYLRTISEEKWDDPETQYAQDAFKNRDYAAALKNVMILMKSCGISGKEEETVLSFFNKYWGKYEIEKPSIICIPFSEVHKLDDSFKNRVLPTILCTKKNFNGWRDNNSNKPIGPEKLCIVDISNIIAEKKLQKTDIGEEFRKKITEISREVYDKLKSFYDSKGFFIVL